MTADTCGGRYDTGRRKRVVRAVLGLATSENYQASREAYSVVTQADVGEGVAGGSYALRGYACERAHRASCRIKLPGERDTK